MTISRISVVDDALVEAFARLIPQLSSMSAPPDRAALEAIVANADAYLLASRDEGGALSIDGVAILTVYRIPTGLQARIDDVVVDDAARGRGIGEALMVCAIEFARAAGAKSVSLTSRPNREAANRLYVRLGFLQLHTNAYRLPLL